MNSVTEWFRDNVQAYLPSVTYVRALLFIALLVFIVACVLIVFVHRYQHRFWHDKPVAWASVLPSRTGILQHSPSHTVPVLPEKYTVSLIRVESVYPNKPAPSTVEQELMGLWGCSVEVVRERCHSMPDTTLLLLHTTSKSKKSKEPNATQVTLVGSLLWAPLSIHTPVDKELMVLVVRFLVVHPDHRGQRLAPALMEHALHNARRKYDEQEPVAVFAVPVNKNKWGNNRLPFAEVARGLTMAVTCRPVLLEDPATEVSHQLVTDVANLPDKATECSQAHIHTALTFEVDAASDRRLAHWKQVLMLPNHRLLNIGGQDWMHLVHHPSQDNTAPLKVELLGCSFAHDEGETIVRHLMQYIKQHCETPPEVQLIVPLSLQSDMENSLRKADTTLDSVWTIYRAQYIYMYNYKLNPENVHIPYTFDIQLS